MQHKVRDEKKASSLLGGWMLRRTTLHKTRETSWEGGRGDEGQRWQHTEKQGKPEELTDWSRSHTQYRGEMAVYLQQWLLYSNFRELDNYKIVNVMISEQQHPVRTICGKSTIIGSQKVDALCLFRRCSIALAS